VSRSPDGLRAATREPGRARRRPWRALPLLAPLALLTGCATEAPPGVPGVPGDTPTTLTWVVPDEPPPAPTDPVRTAKPQIIDDLRDLPGVTEHAPRSVVVDEAAGAAAQDLTVTLQADRRFGNVAIVDGGYVVYWHGEPAPELTAVLDRHPDAAIRVEPTAYLPGEVRDLIPRLVAEVDGVSFAGPEADWSGVTVGVAPDAGHDPEALGRELSARYGLPVTVEVGSVEPAPMTVPAQ
jgi:hypothetical protein